MNTVRTHLDNRQGRKRGIAAVTAVLLCLATVAFMDSHDANSVSSWEVEHSKESVTTAAVDNELDKHVDSLGSWKHLADQAQKVAGDADQLKVTQTAREKEKLAKAKVDKQADELKKKNEAADEKELSREAMQTLKKNVAKKLNPLLKGVGKQVQKAAAKAAYGAVKKKEHEAKVNEDAAKKAIEEEKDVTKQMARITQGERELARIEKQDKMNKREHKKEKLDFAKSMQKSVKRIKDKFKVLDKKLKEDKKAAKSLKQTDKQMAKRAKVADALKLQVHTLQDKIEKMEKESQQSKVKMARAQRHFDHKKEKIVNKMSNLQAKMKHAITVTAVRKATPHKKAQKLLNELITKEHKHDLTIHELSLKLTNLQAEVHNVKKKRGTLEQKTAKQKHALVLANAAIKAMSHAVKTLNQVVAKKDITTHVEHPHNYGVDFEKNLVAGALKTVKKNVHHLKNKQLRKAARHLQNRADPNTVVKVLPAIVDKTKKEAAKKVEEIKEEAKKKAKMPPVQDAKKTTGKKVTKSEAAHTKVKMPPVKDAKKTSGKKAPVKKAA